ncbi:hypothetical protein BFP72_14320 [Reichenbachiella sp. 5M10]|uniref:hypothetical protein n=1 Tax=Reichenbachiella sp. 5M10 TaxID=1889772 RepID=UPI000C15632B|nr:hypothetical protein [Reichenbachiella sp. 5M10]PIB36489.1 hypothetical protein BFP72_14320 [Reichenbachiella sp. 5M10]
MKWIKSIVLVFVLFVPGALYLFLQGFGENKFSIPVYYESGLDTLTACGQVMVPMQYRVDGSDLIDSLGRNTATLYDFGVMSNPDFQSIRNNMMSFLMKFREENRIQLLSFYTTDTLTYDVKGYDRLVYVRTDSQWLQSFAACQLIAGELHIEDDYLSQPAQLVLVDDQQRIRGYYNPRDLEEIDRLNTEIHILLNE